MDFLFDLLNNYDVDITGMIDIKVVILLMAIGFIFKHLTIFKKISNDYIPLILIVISLIINFLNIEEVTINGFTNAFVTSILSAAVAIGMHQQGKGFFKSLKDATNSAFNTFKEELTNNDDEYEEETYEDEIDE